ncbi:MAG: M23 family metallopeptidase [Clostridia bacterium]|nr:M23 family metallopeptidase [Clostridia bacterium]
MKHFFRHAAMRYSAFVEKQGFPIIVTICVGVITASALWASPGKQEMQSSPLSTPSVPVSQPAAQLLQESIRNAATPSPAPTPAPQRWQSPLDSCSILRPFSTEKMVKSNVTELWAVHDALDLQADRGALVRAMSDGTVTGAGNDRLMGVWLEIDHGGGIHALYAGMALSGTFIPGDIVSPGDTIGFVGNGMLEEADLGPHLHLRVTKDGLPLDPWTLWNNGAAAGGL